MYSSQRNEDDAFNTMDRHSDSGFIDEKLLSILDGQRWTPRAENDDNGLTVASRGHRKETAVDRKVAADYTKRRSKRNRAFQDIDRSIDDTPLRSKIYQSLFPPFEWHYDFSASDNLLGNLRTIHKDLGIRSYIHDWDEKLNHVKRLVLYTIHEFEQWGLDSGGHVIASSIIDGIITINGIVYRQRVHPGDSSTKDHSFSLGVCEPLPAPIDKTGITPRLNFGRVMSAISSPIYPSNTDFEHRYTKEAIQSVSRAALLVLYAFTMRLQDEDFTFIRKFVQRHLDAEATFKEPHFLQDVSPSLNSLVRYEISEPSKLFLSSKAQRCLDSVLACER